MHIDHGTLPPAWYVRPPKNPAEQRAPYRKDLHRRPHEQSRESPLLVGEKHQGRSCNRGFHNA